MDLTARNLKAIGTVRSDRTESCFFGVTKKDDRASYDYKSDETVLFVQWKDNSNVTIGTNFSKVSPVDKSLQMGERKRKSICRPTKSYFLVQQRYEWSKSP